MSERMFEYRPIGHHLNDFTFIRKDDVWHLFHITGRAPKGSRALSNEHLAEGHATTKDFIHWREEPHIPQTCAACYALEHQGRYALVKNLSTICWSDDDCVRFGAGRCEDSGQLCSTSQDCFGECENSGSTCTNNGDCAPGEQCLYTDVCAMTCSVQNPVCTEPEVLPFTFEYCEGSFDALTGIKPH